MTSTRVKVGVRIRPLVSSESENGAELVVTAEREKRIRVAVPARNNSFDFDWAWSPAISQRKVYLEACKPLIDSFFDGYNATVFAYGKFFHGILLSLTLLNQAKQVLGRLLQWETTGKIPKKELFLLQLQTYLIAAKNYNKTAREQP
jgi:hypothetical protein